MQQRIRIFSFSHTYRNEIPVEETRETTETTVEKTTETPATEVHREEKRTTGEPQVTKEVTEVTETVD